MTTRDIGEIRKEMELLKEQYKVKMAELHRAQAATFRIKVGDLLEIQAGTYGKPQVKVYLVSKLVFHESKHPDIHGHKRLKGEETFSKAEAILFLRGDEVPRVIGHLDDWRQKILRIEY